MEEKKYEDLNGIFSIRASDERVERFLEAEKKSRPPKEVREASLTD